MTTPLLTISVPSYRRVDLLERCLASVVPSRRSTLEVVELVVNDNSPEADVEHAVQRFSATWGGRLRYHRNPRGTGAVRNFNHCIARANGRYNLILHDDDYLLPGRIDDIVQTLRTADRERDKVFLFGVRDVDLAGDVLRDRSFSTHEFLSPPQALRRVLSDSSFVRVPGLVVQNATYRALDGFRMSAHTTCDFDMSVRLFAGHGVRCVPFIAAAYTIHAGAVTTTVFTPQTIALDLEVFEIARRSGILTSPTVDRLQRRWFHQFILAGTWRALKAGDRDTARRTYGLFDLPSIRNLGVSARWLPVRLAFGAMSGALWRSRAQGRDDDGAAPGTRTHDADTDTHVETRTDW